MNLKEKKGRYMGGFEEGKCEGQWYNYINISKNKRNNKNIYP